jgi:hypothetical protein
MVIGTPPGTGPALVDGVWLAGLAGGQNETYQSGISAAGSTQAGATQLPAGIALIEVDTASANQGLALPEAVAGTELSVYVSVNATVKFYPSVPNNALTGAQDTINGATSITVTGAAAGTVTWFSCAKNGAWSAK